MKRKTTDRDQVVLESLNSCAQALLKSRDFKASVFVVYETCKKLIGADAGYVALLSSDGAQNELLFLDMGNLPCELDPDLPMPIRGLFAEAYSTKKVVYENRFQESEWLPFLPEGHGSLENVLFVPLIIDDRAVGLFGFANKPGGFNDHDVLVVQSFADLAAMGLMKNRSLENLEKNVKHLRTLMQTANDAIITVDQQGKIRFWNRAAEKCFGYSTEEIIGKSCTCLVPEQYIEAHQYGFSRVAQTGIAELAGRQLEVEGLRKNGDTIPVELSISKWQADSGLYFTGIIRDVTLRKQMEDKIRISEKQLRETFKLMKGGGGVYKAVDDGDDFLILEFHNPPNNTALNASGNEIIGRRFLEIFPESRENGLFDCLRRVLKTGKPEYQPVTEYKGSEIRSWRKNYVYKLSSDEVVDLFEDITDRKRMEKALLESENLFRSIFETSPDPINLNRLEDGKFILVNPKFLELTGFRRSEVIGSTAPGINIWKDMRKRDEFFAKLIDWWQVNDFEAEFRRKDGSIITALVSAKLLSYRNEPHLLAVTRDITALKKAEQDLVKAHMELEKRYEASTEKLKESEVKYSSLVDALLTGVYMCVDGRIVFVNRQFVDMFGFHKDELAGMDILELIHPEDRKIFRAAGGMIQPEDNGEGEYESRGVRKNGDIIYLLGRNSSIEFQGREAVLGNVADITKRKEAEQQRQKSEEELRILSAKLLSAEENERKRIARDIHDSIGQALSAIKFSVESSLLSISEKSLSSAQQALEKIIPLTRKSIDEVRRIIMDLRPSSLDDLGLKATVSWFCREFESIFTGIHIEQELLFEENDISPVMKTVVYRIMQEALNNAAKYSGTDFIRLRIIKNQHALEMFIEDNGSGFDVDEVFSREGEQRGMGLASMKERALLSGGTLQIRSIPESGTTIHALWPAGWADRGQQ